MTSQLKGVISLCFASLFWGLWGVFARILGLNFDVFYQSFVRSLILFAVILAYVIIRKSWKKIEAGDFKWFFIILAGGLASGIGSFVGYNHLTISATLFYYFAGFIAGSYLLGKLFFAERLTKIKLIALLLCLTGLLMVFYSSIKLGGIIFIALALTAGLGGAVWSTFSKKITAKYSLAQTLLVDNFNFAAGSFILALVFKEAIVWPSFSLLWLYVVLFSLAVLVASFLHFYGIKYVQAQIGGLILLLEVVFGVFFGWLFFKETLTMFPLIGGVMIILGAALPNLFPNDKSNKPKSNNPKSNKPKTFRTV